MLFNENQGKNSVIHDVHKISIRSFGNPGLPHLIFYFFNPDNFHQDQIGHGRYPHGPPYLIVVMIFVEHQLIHFGNTCIIMRNNIVLGQVNGMTCFLLFQQNQGHKAIINNADKFVFNGVVYFLIFFLIYRPDPGRFNINLVRDGRWPENPPGGAVIIVLLNKQLPGFLYYPEVLLRRSTHVAQR